jgi:hypothetical protein
MLAACRCGVHGAYIGLGLGACPRQRYGLRCLPRPYHRTILRHRRTALLHGRSTTRPAQHNVRLVHQRPASHPTGNRGRDLSLVNAKRLGFSTAARLSSPSTVAVALTFLRTSVDSAFEVLSTILLTSVDASTASAEGLRLCLSKVDTHRGRCILLPCLSDT